MEEEIWKIYHVFKCARGERKKGDICEISSKGRLRIAGEIIEPKIHFNYYYIPTGGFIHRLVAENFIPNPENKPCVDHINTNKLDNRIENLRWVTHKENNNNPLTVEHRKNIVYSEQALQNIHNANIKMKEYVNSLTKEERNNKYGAQNIGRTYSMKEETKKKISEANKGLKRSEEQNRRNGEITKQKWLNPEFRKKCCLGAAKAAKGKHRVYENPEHSKWHMEY